MKQATAGVLLGILLVGSIPVALADDREGFRGDRRDGFRGDRRDGFRGDRRDGFRDGHWEGREIHRFGERDLHIWQGGRWHHGRHDGRLGWWWIAAGMWYFYPRPVYPYPDPYTPAVTVINQRPVVVVPPQTAPVQVQPQRAAQLWYYCESAQGYYPYVPNCAEGWRAVPAQTPAAPR